MTTYRFTVSASGLSYQDSNFEDWMHGAGFGNDTVSVRHGVVRMDCVREADTLEAASMQVIKSVEVMGGKIVAVAGGH